jgi:UDP-2,3-diacylglucosamine hydrolase
VKYFISDLHLSESEPALTELFYRFLADHAPQMQALYILGDFFDAWIGDDDDRPLAHAVAAALTQTAGTAKVFFMHGNRDFLLGSAYAQRCGMALLPEILPVNEARIVLCHGDHLCTQDLAYQSFRAQVRNPHWQANFLAEPLAARRAFAAQARAQSQAHQKELMPTIADVDADAVMELQCAHPALTVIHGHTHRPGVHQTIQGQRIVLGDWRDGEPSWLGLDGSNGELVAHGQSWRFAV